MGMDCLRCALHVADKARDKVPKRPANGERAMVVSRKFCACCRWANHEDLSDSI